MDKTQGKIGTKEFIALIMITVGTKLADNRPTILYENLQNAAWIGMIIISLVSIIPIYFLTKVLTNYPDKNLFDVMTHLFGKYLGFFVIFILWILHNQAVVLSVATYTDIIGTMYFTKTPVLILGLVLIIVAIYGASKGIEGIGSIAWFTFIWIKLSLLIVLVVVFFQGQTSFLFPIFGPGKLEIIKESTMNLSLFGEFLFIGFIASSIKSTKTYKKGIWIGFVFVSLEFIFSLIGYIMLFDYKGIQLINYPYHEAIRFIEFGFITNVESLFFPFWLVATFIRFTFGLYISALMFGALFKVQNFKYAVPALATVLLFLSLIPETPVFTNAFFKVINITIFTPIIFILPLILWTTAKVRGEFKK